MSAAFGWDWVFFVVGGLLGLAAAWLLWRGLLADRARGRARCPKCWYDLTALAGGGSGGAGDAGGAAFSGMRCSECGRAIRKARQLRRTRRRWWVVLAGVFVGLVASGVVLTPKVRRDGPWSIVPTWVMLRIAERVPLGKWPEFDAAIHGRLCETGTPDELIDEYLLKSGRFTLMRERYPRRVGIPVSMAVWFVAETPSPAPRVLAISSGTKRPLEIRAIRRTQSYEVWWLDGTSVFPADTTVVEFWVDQTNRSPRALNIPVTFVDSVDDCVSPVDSPVLTAEVARLLKPRITEFPTSKDILGLSVTNVTGSKLDDVTLGFFVTFRDGEHVIATANWWQRTTSNISMAGLPVMIEGDVPALQRAMQDADNPRYTVRFRGDGETALRDFKGTKYWAGEFTLPLRQLLPDPSTVGRPPGAAPAEPAKKTP